MKKSMRTLLSLLVALALLVSLPISALAMDNNEEGYTVTVPPGETMNTNNGIVTENNGTINNNLAVKNEDAGGYQENTGIVEENNGYIVNNGDKNAVLPGSGTVGKNNDHIDNNYGEVTTNSGAIKNNEGVVETNKQYGTITNNSGTINTNEGFVETNTESGTITNNSGTVGSYEEDDEGNPTTIPDEETGNKGTIGGNTGNVVVNDGTIHYNGAVAVKDSDDFIKDESAQVETDATVEINNGVISENIGIVDTNYGTVSKNSGTIDWNAKNWEYDKELDDFITVQGVVDNNSGFVEENDGIVTNIEGGKVWYNWNIVNNEAGGEVRYNWNIVNNEAGGEVLVNYATVNNEAGGKVLVNDATVNNEAGGEVLENYGIVNNEAGGVLNDVVVSVTEDEDGEINFENDYKSFTGEKGTYCATILEVGSTETIDEATGETALVENVPDEGVFAVIKQSIKDSVMDLKEVGTLFNREGYEVIGYEAFGDMNYSGDSLDTDEFTGPSVVYETTYKVTGTSGLRLVWGKVKGVIVPPPVVEIVPETEEYTIPNYMIAKYVREGTVIQRGTHLFKVIAVEDGTILVATMGRLNQADLDDMMGFLAKYFSEAQLERLIGEPELLSEELTEEHFGDELEHICFHATTDLFEG